MADDQVDEGLVRINRLSAVKQRLIESSVAIAADDPLELAYQHSIFCAVGLPYRNPGDDVRLWHRSHGAARLEVQGGRAHHPARDEFVDIGLPWGTKPRLILAHLNGEALRTGSPTIDPQPYLAYLREKVSALPAGA